MINQIYNSNIILPVIRWQNQAKWLASFMLLSIVISTICSKSNASTDATAENSCEAVASEAEEAFSLPEGILSAIARVESGRQMQDGGYKAWPWTINDNGKGLFFDTRQSAIDYINKQEELNNTGIDIGCMQISVKWHANAFSSHASMLDPYTNIAYAAIFLEELYQNHGEWDLAIKHYHSADTQKNVPYLQKVNAVWKNQAEPATQPSTASASYETADQLRNNSNPENDYSDASNPSFKITYTDDTPETMMPSVEIGSKIAEETIFAASEEIAQSHSDKQPTEKFAQTQPYLAREWEKVIHFRKLFSAE